MKKVILSLMLVSLTGCAGLTDGMKNINNGLSTINGTAARSTSLSTSTSTIYIRGWNVGAVGYQPQFNVQMPTSICSSTAYMAGWQDKFVENWNPFIDLKKMQYQNNPNNLSLYKDKTIVNYQSHASQYVLNLGLSANNCEHIAYLEGGNAGMAAFSSEKLRIAAQEQ